MNVRDIIFVMMTCVCFMGLAVTKSDSVSNRLNADARLKGKIVELNKLITSFRTYFQQISPKSLEQYRAHYSASWNYQLESLFKTIQEIIATMPLSSDGKMDVKNIGLVAETESFIKEKSKIFFDPQFNVKAVSIPASNREFDRQEAKIRVKTSLIPGIGDKKLTIAVKKTLYNVLELLKMMYEKMQGTLIDVYTLETITSPYKQERFVHNVIMNTWEY